MIDVKIRPKQAGKRYLGISSNVLLLGACKLTYDTLGSNLFQLAAKHNKKVG